MIASLVVLMGLAAVFGFLLTVYFFFYRVRLSTPLKWVGGIGGGLITGALMAVFMMILLWPPVNLFLVGGGLVMAGFLAVVVLTGQKQTGGAQFSQCSLQYEEGEGDDVGVCSFGFDPDTSTRP